ncbi:hypothetical protein GF406_07060 [candidate division KSB1 bacterium]|nr:hypothetical protein [candidate division KSB1 bacterium]
MTMQLLYSTAENSILKCFDNVAIKFHSTHRQYYRLQYNRFNPGSDTLWLSPESDNPGFKYGKFAFFHDKKQNLYKCGISIEKGYGKDAKQIFKIGSEKIMDESWIWHQFVKDCSNGKLSAAIEALSDQHFDIELEMLYQFVDDSSTRQPIDQVYFFWEPRTRAFLMREMKSGLDELKFDSNSLSLEQLGNFIKSYNDAFHWQYLFLSVPLLPGKQTKLILDAGDIVQKILNPLASWVR